MALPVASTTTSSFVARLRPKPSSAVAGHVDPARPPQPPVFPEHHLREGAVDVHSDHAPHPILLQFLGQGSGGRHDNYGSALAAQPGESQRRPATNASSQLIVSDRPAHASCSRCPAPGWSHHTRRSSDHRRASAPRASYRLRTCSNACSSRSAGAEDHPQRLRREGRPEADVRCPDPRRRALARRSGSPSSSAGSSSAVRPISMPNTSLNRPPAGCTPA